MFVYSESTDNMLKYRLEPGEEPDLFSLQMLHANAVQGILLPGQTASGAAGQLLFPTAGCVRLEDHLRQCAGAAEPVRILLELLDILDRLPGYMIPEEELLLRFDFAFVDRLTKQLKLICLPVSGSAAYAAPLPAFCCEALAAGLEPGMDGAEEQKLIELLSAVRAPDFSPGTFRPQLTALLPDPTQTDGPAPEPAAARKPGRRAERRGEQRKEHPAEHRPKRAGLLQRLSAWMAGPEEAGPDADEAAFEPAEPMPDSGFGVGFGVRPAAVSVSAGIRSPYTCFLTVRATGQELALQGASVVIGGDRDLADLSLPDNPYAAREHCRIFPERGRYYVEDLNTESGTYRNGVRVRMWEPKELEAADVIRVGDDEIIYSERMGASPENGGTALIFEQN